MKAIVLMLASVLCMGGFFVGCGGKKKVKKKPPAIEMTNERCRQWAMRKAHHRDPTHEKLYESLIPKIYQDCVDGIDEPSDG